MFAMVLELSSTLLFILEIISKKLEKKKLILGYLTKKSNIFRATEGDIWTLFLVLGGILAHQ